ncbi:type II toxin-antitoxin system VapC family toxin [Pollutimonas bauzanensis]|uniref:Predicted nucleic-acid-binding protein, contains PIN domain n=1 Tax=Pollutimonas bauzanensis TaxID=658167 RepID=A0A1M5ZE03_9BURK|nr:type II toxin-antitoxin system VapC family toxin [Pollutimonas bauzanensis]SHI22412.1 Predicted nucleic-acid-binding protein, contains PIN domain [Pollutimonas bauzanensis]
MKITVDTNVVLRYLLNDDKDQAAIARKTMQDAALVAIPLSVLCEVVWTLSRGYKMASDTIAGALEALTEANSVAVNRSAVETGLVMLRAGGDFADGVIANEGLALGGETFVTFDKKAAAILKKHRRMQTRLLS